MPLSITSPEEDLVFLDETVPLFGNTVKSVTLNVWRVMIIDDDDDVHAATKFALSNLEMQQRPLQFLHAYSAAEARQLLAKEKDIAVILLDVVMEQDDAGLNLVRYIREVLKLAEVRIILRTGQPGYAPEIDAIRDFDINDYKTKSELTRIKLYTTVTAAIRSYEQIQAINENRRGLNLIVRASTELMALHGLQNFADGVLGQVAKLLGHTSEGLLCVREKEQKDLGSQLFVISGVGHYSHLSGKPVADALIGGKLEDVLKLRRNIYSDTDTVLYFGGSDNREFAVFLNHRTPVSETHQRLLEVFCSTIAVGLDNVMLLTRLHDFAFHDPLTKFPNRRRLKELLKEALLSEDKDDTTLALVDIDHFAETNDAFGHQFGDTLLLGVAARLQACFCEKLIIGRVGGDTFGIIGDSKQVNPSVLLGLFETPFSIDGHNIQLSATIGLVRLADYENLDADALKDADIALKRAKLQQRAGHFYFSRSMGVDIRERVRMMHALRNAFSKKELFLTYQPQIDLVSRRPIGAEALLRWKTADGTFISPDRFIPIAEYSGLIIELGDWVLHKACKELVNLQKQGYDNFRISVNVSQVQFRHPHFLDMLRQALEETQAPPSLLELEITESIAMEEPDVLVDLLEKIKKIGVSIAIDDFGTGFSSLSYLQRLSADKLKIDRTFVTEITHSSRGSSIAEMVVQLGRNLGMSVIAEGVEDERQAAKLASIGCPLAQGYLFAKPMPIDQLSIWLNQHNAGYSE